MAGTQHVIAATVPQRDPAEHRLGHLRHALDLYRQLGVPEATRLLADLHPTSDRPAADRP
jgi:hypothetical protein